jgi:hypothetical protein
MAGSPLLTCLPRREFLRKVIVKYKDNMYFYDSIKPKIIDSVDFFINSGISIEK